MLKNCALLLVIFMLLTTVGVAQENGWTTLTAGQSIYGIRYDQNGAIIVNNELVMGCTIDPRAPDETKVYVSSPSPLKSYVLVMCWDAGGKEAYVIDTRNNRIASRDVVPKHWRIIKWVSWSPNERFALVAAAGEITMGDMAFVDLASGRLQEINFKNLTNNRGIDPRKTIYERIQDFDPDKISWLSPTSFSLNMDVRCNPYEVEGDCYEKVISSHPVRINLSPFSISYGNVGQARSPRTKPRVSARGARADEGIRNVNSRSVSNIRRIDFLNFTYQTSLCSNNDVGLSKTVTVRSGEFKQGNDADEAYFGIVNNKIIYGDLTGDLQEEAIVHTACGHTMWNYGLEEVFIYTMQNGRAVLLAESNQDQMINDYHRYYPDGSLWSTTNNQIRIRGGALWVDWYADGAHCCPKYIVTLEYRWNGKQLILNRRPQKRVFKQ